MTNFQRIGEFCKSYLVMSEVAARLTDRREVGRIHAEEAKIRNGALIKFHCFAS